VGREGKGGVRQAVRDMSMVMSGNGSRWQKWWEERWGGRMRRRKGRRRSRRGRRGGRRKRRGKVEGRGRGTHRTERVQDYMRRAQGRELLRRGWAVMSD